MIRSIKQTGCDSFITLHLVVLPDSVILNKFLCPGYSFNFNGTIINIPGTYRDTLINQLGCDSIVILHLKNGITSSSNLVATVCSNYPFQIGNKFYNQNGIYFDTLTNYLGCDSFITLQLTVNPVSNSTLQKSICKNNPYYFHKLWLNVTGVYFDTLSNYLGCDSIISLNLKVSDTSLTILQSTICNHQSLNFHHQSLTKSGIYFDTLKNQSGCDSILQLQLTVIPSSSVIINESVCSNKPYQFNKKLIDSSGVYYDTMQNYRGCDSIITLQLRMYPQHPIVKNVLGRLTAYGSGYDKVTWINCDNKKPLSTANPYDVNESGNYAVVVEQDNCNDTSDCEYIDIDCNLIAMPNPAKDDIQVEIKCGDKSFHIELTDVLGRKLFQDDIKYQDKFTLYRNGLSSGIYFVFLYNEHHVKMVQKVVWE